MKLPFDLGVKLFFRLLLPGFVLLLGLLPVVHTFWDLANWRVSTEYTLVLGTILTGWFVSALDMPIYMLFEGRRFWPDPVRDLFIKWESQRLAKIQGRIVKFKSLDRQKYLEASVEVRKFPLDVTGQYEAQFPTRLGNLLAAYETYPRSRYGMDAIFYWYRIWLNLEKDTKEEIDNRSAFADGSVYTSLAAMVTGLLWLLYGGLAIFQVRSLEYLPSPILAWLLAFVFLSIGYTTYRLSVFTHAQFGEVFKSVFDVYAKTIDVTSVVTEVARLTNDPSLNASGRSEQLELAWRYLHNYRVKCAKCGEVISPPELRSHSC